MNNFPSTTTNLNNGVISSSFGQPQYTNAPNQPIYYSTVSVDTSVQPQYQTYQNTVPVLIPAPSYAQTNVRTVPRGSNGWKRKLCDCQNPGTCCYACWCPCCIYGDITKALHGRHDCWYYTCANFLLFPIALPLFVFGSCVGGAFVSAQIRREVRESANIDGDLCSDLGVHCFCHACALAQSYHEVTDKQGYSYQ